MPPAADKLVRAAMERLGTKGPSDFAKKIGLSGNGYQRVHRWLNGENEPDYEATMTILDRCGWLNLEGSVATGDVAPPADLADRLAALEAEVGELARADAVQAGFDTLRTAIDRGASSRTRPAAARRKKAG